MGEIYYTIGQVVQKLRSTFPDLSISKVRYLEDEGLIRPHRTTSGYRKFSQEDLQQLEMVLKLQKEQFLPLSVIKDKMKSAKPDELSSEFEPEQKKPILSFSEDDKRFTLEELVRRTGLEEQEIKSLETYGLLKPEETSDGKAYDSSDVKLATLARRFSKSGLEPRHLRMYGTFADREASLLWQILLPEFKKAKIENDKLISELAELLSQSQELKDTLLRRALHHYFGKNLS